MKPTRDPGFYEDYPSSFVSKYYTWFKDLGYPQLDIIDGREAYGEWHIIEMLNGPVVPSLCKWKYVLQGIDDSSPSFGFVKNYVELLDITKQAYWDHEAAKSRKVIKENEDTFKHRQRLSERAAEIVRKHPHLQERVAKHGLREALPWHIATHLPPRVMKSNFKSKR
jgi:hypothetical protein